MFAPRLGLCDLPGAVLLGGGAGGGQRGLSQPGHAHASSSRARAETLLAEGRE